MIVGWKASDVYCRCEEVKDLPQVCTLYDSDGWSTDTHNVRVHTEQGYGKCQISDDIPADEVEAYIKRVGLTF